MGRKATLFALWGIIPIRIEKYLTPCCQLFPQTPSLWYFGVAVGRNGTPSMQVHVLLLLEGKLWYPQMNINELRNCRSGRARSLRSPSPAPSPGWRGPPCSAGSPLWRIRTSNRVCCCSSCSWHHAPCASPSAWLCPAPRCAADSQPGEHQPHVTVLHNCFSKVINTEIIIIQHDLFQVTGFSKLENIKVVKLDFYSKANMKERDELKDKVRKLLKNKTVIILSWL